MRGFRFLEMRGGCGSARVSVFLRPITRPLAREEERLAHIVELAGGRSGAEEKAQEREKNGTSGVHWGGYFAPHDTNNNFWILDFYLRTQYTRAPTDGPSLTRWVHSSSYFCSIPRPHSF
jgi:hypothetical protein